MRKLKSAFAVLLVMAVSLIVSSCSSDSHDIEDENTAPAALVGKWILSNVKPLDNNTYEMNDCNRKSSIQFSSKGTFHRISYFSLLGNCELEADEKGTYAYDSANHKITIKYEDIDEGGQTEVWNNVEITGNTFSYTWQEDDRLNYDDWKVTYAK